MTMEEPLPKRNLMSDMRPVQKKAPLRVAKKARAVPKPAEEPVPAFSRGATVERHVPTSTRTGAEPAKRGGCFLVAVGIVCALALALAIGGLWNHARVTITRQSFSGQVDTTVKLSQVRMAGTVRLATATRTFTVQQVVPASGTQGADSNATGTVRMYNSGSSMMKIPLHAVLVSSSGLNYVTQKAVSVPAQRKNVPGEVDVAILAQSVGSTYNHGPDDFSFSGTTYPTVTVRSLTALSGGSSKADSVADPALVASASASVAGSVPDAATLEARMAQEVPDTMVVLPISFPSSAPTVSVDPGHADGVHVVASETVSILLADRSELARALGDVLSVPESTNVTLDSLDGLSITTGTVASSALPPTALQVRVTGNAMLYGLVGTDGLAAKLAGQSKSAVSGVLSKIAEIKSFSIRLTPFWRRTLPSNPLDITVEGALVAPFDFLMKR